MALNKGFDEVRSVPVVVSLTKYIPHAAIPHAGGQYVWQQDAVLQSFTDLVHLAPDTPMNRAAAARSDSSVPARLFAGRGPGKTGKYKTLFDIESAWAGSSIGWPYRRLFASDRAPWETLRAADIIEMHWSEMIALAPSIRRRLPQAFLVGIAHDVITQRWQRAATQAGNRLGRAGFSLAARRSRSREARSFAALDMLIVFSEKDAELARALAPALRIEVVHPGMGSPNATRVDRSETDPIVLFTGALDRPDNYRAVEWFVKSMWPQVQRDVPESRLVVAGANPPPSLTAIAEQDSTIELTGFVDSLEPYYEQARVFVSPLRTGAGVKFKTLDAMIRALPIVSTTVGAEGIDGTDLFAAVTDDEDEFAEAVVRELLHPNTDRADRASDWANEIYGHQAFHDRVVELYRSALRSR